MDRDEIMQMARAAGIENWWDKANADQLSYEAALKRFAALVSAAERAVPSIPNDVWRDAMRYRFVRVADGVRISHEAARDPVAYDEAIDRAMEAAEPKVKPTRWTPYPEELAAIRAAQEQHAPAAEMPGGAVAFLNYGEADSADYAHLDCPACGGSGHVGDTRAGAFRDVLAERRRQIEVEGWTPEHDDEHSTQELAFAAACYATADEGDAPPAVWPWHLSWWKPTDRRHNLVKAGALILAEIERLDRMAAKQEGA